jgi:DNA-binding protein YbaB
MGPTWGFEEDEEEYDPLREPADEPDEELLTGKDSDEVVTIGVTDTADLASVRLDPNWRDKVDPRALGTKVVEAMNAATIAALGKQSESIDVRSQAAGTGAAPATSQSIEDERPFSMEDALRLFRAVSTDLAEFKNRLSEVRNQTVTVESGGGHVTVSGMRRQVGSVSLDQTWLHGAAEREIESEVRDALTSFIAKSTPDDAMRQGPQSSAIDELRSLVADPQALIRRIRQRPTS